MEVMSSDHIFNNNIHRNGNTTNDSQKETEPNAPLVGQPSAESSKPNTKNEEKNSLDLLDRRIGATQNIVEEGTGKLINYIEELSGTLTSSEKHYIEAFVYGAGKGYASTLPAICKGQSCPFLLSCPLYKLGKKLPVGSVCPVELTIINQWINKHLPALGIEDPDAPEHSFDMDLIHELAGQALIQWRCSCHLSETSAMMEEVQTGATQANDPLYEIVIHPALEVMERSGRNMVKIREALVATREAQLKAGRDTTDGSNTAAAAKERAKLALQKARDQQAELRKIGIERANSLNTPPEEVKEADYEIVEQESNIDNKEGS